MDKLERARREGMSYALSVAKEKGIEGLEEDLKRRNALDIPVGLKKSDLDKFSEKVKINTVKTIMTVLAVTLHDELGFGHKRIKQVIDRFLLKCECISDEYVTLEENAAILREECGMDIDVTHEDITVRVSR